MFVFHSRNSFALAVNTNLSHCRYDKTLSTIVTYFSNLIADRQHISKIKTSLLSVILTTQTCCDSNTFPAPETIELEVWKLTLRKKAYCGLTRLPGIFFFFSKAPSFTVHVYTRSGGWHTDLSLGWRPAAGAALAARPWETGGRHPNVITAAKLLSIKAKLQKYVPRGLPTMKTEARLRSCCPSSAVEVVLRYVLWALLWVRNSRFHSCWQTSGCACGWLCGNSYWVSPAIIMLCYCSSSWCDVHLFTHTVWGSAWLTIGYIMQTFILMTWMFWSTVAWMSESPAHIMKAVEWKQLLWLESSSVFLFNDY